MSVAGRVVVLNGPSSAGNGTTAVTRAACTSQAMPKLLGECVSLSLHAMQQRIEQWGPSL
jgi:hypothetical protein